MKRFRYLFSLVCVVASFVLDADEQPAAVAKATADQPIAVELQSLQGTWEGVDVGDESHQKVAITITGNSLHFHRDTNFWFGTTIAVPAGTEPKQLHATIKSCPPSQADSIGKVVGAIFKIDDGTLTLVAYGMSDEPPKTFADATSKYVLKPVQPRKGNSESPQSQIDQERHDGARSSARIPFVTEGYFPALRP